MKQLIIFDLDGTLIQSEIDYMGIRDKVRNILRDLIEPDEFKIIQETPTTILSLVELVKEYDKSGKLYEKAWNIVEEEEYLGYRNANIESDVHPTLQTLVEKNYKITILTNNSRKLTDFGMKKFELFQYTNYIITRNDVEIPKPNPEGLFKIIKHFGVSKDQTIFIGDSWLDAETAQIAGIDFIYFGNESAPGTRRKKIEVSKIINTMSELLEFL